MSSISQIDSILKMLRQTQATEFVNDGPYIAVVDMSVGDQVGPELPDSSGSSSSATEPDELALWTVDVTRASPTADQIVRFWIPMVDLSDGGGASDIVIYGLAVIAESPSASNPYGEFELHFSGQINGDTDPSKQIMYGVLKTISSVPGYHGFDYYESGESGDRETQVTLHINDADTDQGAGRISQSSISNPLDDEDFAFAFNSDYFVKNEDSIDTVLDRNDLHQYVWNYNIYTTTDNNLDGEFDGELVEHSSGFSINHESLGTNTHGYLSYYGLWSEDESVFTDGVTVTSDDAAATEYTLHISPGRLVKATAELITLDDLDGTYFTWWEYNEITFTDDAYLLLYDHSDDIDADGIGSFHKTATGTWDDTEGWVFVDLGAPVEKTFADDETTHFWADTLGTDLRFVGGTGCAVNSNSELCMTVHIEEVASGDSDIFASGASLQLSGWRNTLQAEINQTEYNNGDIADIFESSVENYADPAYELSFRESDLTLYDSLNAQIGLAHGVVQNEASPFSWGMRSGPLLDADMIAEADGLGITESWELFDRLSEFYVYETGLNSWNKFYYLEKNSDGTLVSFDPPMRMRANNLELGVSAENPDGGDINGDSTYDGVTLALQYGGPGDLWGFPWAEDSDGNYRPALNMPAGYWIRSSLNDDEYVIKPVEIELSMTDVSLSVTLADALLETELTAASTLGLGADSSDWDNECLSESDPGVTDPPAVILGVIQ